MGVIITPANLTAAARLPSRGVAHDHYRLDNNGDATGGGPEDGGRVLRVPRRPHPTLSPADALAQQAAAFARAAPSGHTPPLTGVIPPNADLPLGGLLVGLIIGRPPRLPDDLPAIATALAAIHALPLPAAADRAPLDSADQPAAALWDFVRRRATVFADAGLTAAAQSLLRHQLAQAAEDVRRISAQDADRPTVLVGADVHPGNFMITADGAAIFTDLERAQYGHPGADLAHATLATSTRWDPLAAATLTPAEVSAFYGAWEAAVGVDLASTARPAHAALRRLVWLRTLAWMADWRRRRRDALSPGQDAAHEAHMDRHADYVLSPAGLAEVAATL